MINRSHELAPWADCLYGCDYRFWEQHPEARAFAGLKVSQDARACEAWPDIHRVNLVQETKISTEPGVIGSGGNGGFQATNLAALWGAAKIVLVGFDMTVTEGVHWHGRHASPLSNPDYVLCESWRAAFDEVAPALKQMGIDVINATPGSALKCFPMAPLETALQQ